MIWCLLWDGRGEWSGEVFRRLFNPRGLSAAGWEADTLGKSMSCLILLRSVPATQLVAILQRIAPMSLLRVFKSGHRLQRWLAAGSFILMCEYRVATKTATDSQVYGAVVPCASTGSSFEDHARGQTSGIPASWHMQWKVLVHITISSLLEARNYNNTCVCMFELRVIPWPDPAEKHLTPVTCLDLSWHSPASCSSLL